MILPMTNASGGEMSRGKPAGTPPQDPSADAEELSKNLADIAERSQRLVTEFLGGEGTRERSGWGAAGASGASFCELTGGMRPPRPGLTGAKIGLGNFYQPWGNRPPAGWGDNPAEPVIEAAPDDRRFRDREWNDNA